MLPQKVHESQKAALMKATVKTVVEHGFEKTSLRTIGSISGVNEVYIYRYFKNKDDLLAQTFRYADEFFLKFILENFPVMSYESVDYEMRCRMLFKKCWDCVMSHRDWLIFYIRYYYSSAFMKNSYDDHIARYSVLIDRMRPACHPDAEVETVLHHILETLLGQARKQITHPQDERQAENDTFWLLFSVLKCGKGI